MKKLMFLVGSVVATLAMTTGVLAAAKVGDVDNDGGLTANDAAVILQYSLDNNAVFANPVFMDRGEIDKDATITANDAALVLQASLSSTSLGEMPEDTDTYLDITLPSGTTVSTLFDYADTDKVIDVVDSIIAEGKYDTAISTRLDAINARISRFTMTSQNGNNFTLKNPKTWDKIATAFAPVIADTNAFNNIAATVQKAELDLNDLKAIYADVKTAVPASSLTEANIMSAAANARAVVADGSFTVSVTCDNGTFANDILATYLLTCGFNNYDTVTVADFKTAFGNSAAITVNNTTVTVAIAER